MAFSLPWAGKGLYQYLHGRHWAFYGFITVMGDTAMPIFKIEAENGQYIRLLGPLLV